MIRCPCCILVTMSSIVTELFNMVRPRYPELSGKVAIITGSSQGIGQGIAVRLAREGMHVVINGLNAADCAETTSELVRLGCSAVSVPADLKDPEQIQRLFDETLRAFGTLDLVVNNAADMRRIPLVDQAEDVVDHQLATNVRAPYLVTRRAAEIMRPKSSGSILSISSVGGLRAHWTGLPYDITKGAIDAMTRAMALELSPFGIRVNAIAPGATWNPTWARREKSQIEPVKRRIPLGRLGHPTDIAAAAAFLASDEASYITGQVIYVDGGITAQLYPPGQNI
jgi:NAD(P)-dependent dehydrogenase (short-subunit alcohol dehydrogenase family)